MIEIQYNQDDIIYRLAIRCEQSTQRAVAKDFGISPQYLSDILKGRRPLPNAVALKMGYRVRTLYVAVKP